jgi:hypothetical protein
MGSEGGRPAKPPWLPDTTLQPLAGQLHDDTLQEAVTGNPKLKVGGGWTPWLPSHVARPAGHHLVSYRLNLVGNPSLDPYKYPYRWKSTHHNLLVVLHL